MYSLPEFMHAKSLPLQALLCVAALPALGLPFPKTASGDESLKDIACRSVHLQYQAPEGAAFYNELTIDRSAPGSYFMACGFSRGYFGLQELADGKKLAIFSVWEPGDQNDPEATPESQRVKLLFQGEGVRIGRFGNEGTGGQSFFDYDWKPGETYRLLVAARLAGERTEYAACLYLPESRQWKHLATFSTPTRGERLRGYYAFIEDFRRNRVSATQERTARFGAGWIRTNDGRWLPLTEAKFTADRNPVENIDAGVMGNRFFLATGGTTENKGTKLAESIRLPAPADQRPPAIVEDGLKAAKLSESDEP
ncbi:MAG TPA: DUF3472 domain-containing protein [Pirellulales bacterium]|jgi:hypothetical protein|nr:DUF3472 domain-containing protein [Pirellulales bacterium]